MAIRGDAAFTYTDPSTGAQVFTMQAPLKDITAVQWTNRFASWAADGTTRNVVSVGSPLEEIEADIRYESDVDGLEDLLRNGLNDVTLTYYHVYNGGAGTGYTCKLVAVNGSSATYQLQPDADLGFQKRHQCRVRLRRTSGTWDTLLNA